MKKVLLFALLVGLLVVQVTGAKRNKKNKGDKEVAADNMEVDVDDMESSVENDDTAVVDGMLTEDNGMADKDDGKGSDTTTKGKHHKKANECVYSFSVPQTEDKQACSAMDQETKSKLDMLDMKNQQQDALIVAMRDTVTTQLEQLQLLQSQLTAMGALMSQATNPMSMHAMQGGAGMDNQMVYRDCQHVIEESGIGQPNGVFEIHPWNAVRPFKVQCDMEDPEGVWTVIQARSDGSVNFNMDWIAYKVGFGDVNGEYWVGNENLHKLTTQSKYMLRVEFEDWEGNHLVAEYDGFRIDNEYFSYKLNIGKYNGTAGDSMSYHNNQKFSTPDMDNDSSEPTHCAKSYISGWWFNNCFHSNLNGYYHQSNDLSNAAIGGVSWYTLKETNMYSLKAVTMKVRRLGFV
ncbi:fibrinogen-like protein 1 [Glandiceps talaboti]